MTTAIYPGSFDPITLGHLNIIRRASKIFDKVVVCVMVNSAKKPMFSREERVELIERTVKRLSNVTVDTSDVLLAEYAKRYEHPVLIKGLRAVSDFEKEAQLAQEAGLSCVSIGPRILRCETAPVAALCAIMYETGNFDIGE